MLVLTRGVPSAEWNEQSLPDWHACHPSSTPTCVYPRSASEVGGPSYTLRVRAVMASMVAVGGGGVV